MTQDDVMELIGEFTWFWTDKFFIETGKGNFVWSDPDYNGNNTIIPFNGTLSDFIKSQNVDFGRYKGIHKIKDYVEAGCLYKEWK